VDCKQAFEAIRECHYKFYHFRHEADAQKGLSDVHRHAGGYVWVLYRLVPGLRQEEDVDKVKLADEVTRVYELCKGPSRVLEQRATS